MKDAIQKGKTARKPPRRYPVLSIEWQAIAESIRQRRAHAAPVV